MKSISYLNIEEMLNDRKAVDNGRYFLCNCPECEEPEAFIYKNNPRNISCNRAEECGERFFVKYENVKDLEEIKLKQLKKSYPDLNKKQINSLEWFKQAMKHFDEYDEGSILNDGYRGISRETTKGNVVDLKERGFVDAMFHKLHPLFTKDYRNNDFMAERNIVLPIYDEKGNPERMLLRSTINPSAEPKEIQLILNPSKQARDFFIDVPEDADTIVITEALFDGLSFREVDPSVGFIALTGSQKTRQVEEYLKGNKEKFADKKLIFALDNDKAGLDAQDRLVGAVETNGIGNEWTLFDYPVDISDPNDYLQMDRKAFKSNYESSMENFRKTKESGFELSL